MLNLKITFLDFESLSHLQSTSSLVNFILLNEIIGQISVVKKLSSVFYHKSQVVYI